MKDFVHDAHYRFGDDLYIDTPDDLVLRIIEGDTEIKCPLAGTAKHSIFTHVEFIHVLGENMAWYRCTHCRQTWPIELTEPPSGDLVMLENYRHPYDDRRRETWR